MSTRSHRARPIRNFRPAPSTIASLLLALLCATAVQHPARAASISDKEERDAMSKKAHEMKEEARRQAEFRDSQFHNALHERDRQLLASLRLNNYGTIPPVVLSISSPHVKRATNYWGTRYEVPFGSYDGSSVIDFYEEIVSESMSPQNAWIRQGAFDKTWELTDDDPAVPIGWNFEPVGMLQQVTEFGGFQISEPGEYVAGWFQCYGVTTFRYLGRDRDLTFRAKGVEDTCQASLSYNTGTGPDVADECRVLCGGSATEFWSTDEQVSLVFENGSPVLSWSDGRRETFVTHAGPGFPRAMVVQHEEALFFAPRAPALPMSQTWTTDRIVDANGNVTTFEYDGDLVRRAVDSAGRTTTYTRRPDGLVSSIARDGIGGAPQTWILDWQSFTWDPKLVFPEFDECYRYVNTPPYGGAGEKTPCPKRSYTALVGMTEPDGRKYTFSYRMPDGEPGYGALTRVETPDGAVIDYRYGTAGTPANPPPHVVVGASLPTGVFSLYARRLVSTTVRPLGDGMPEYTTTYVHEPGVATTTPTGCRLQWTKVLEPDGTAQRSAICMRDSGTGIRSPSGRLFATETWTADPDAGGQLVAATYFGNPGGLGVPVAAPFGELFLAYERSPKVVFEPSDGAPHLPNFYLSDTPLLDQRPTERVEFREGVWWKTTYAYDTAPIVADGGRMRTYGNVVQEETRAADATVLRMQVRRFETDAAHVGRNLIRLLAFDEVRDGYDTVLARTQWRYDEDEEGSLVPSGMAANRRVPVGNVRGNPTSLIEFVDEVTSLTTRTRYHDNGAIAEVAAPRAHGDLGGAYTTTFAGDFVECSAGHPILELTTTSPTPANGMGAHVEVTRVDCWTGAMLRSVAVDGAVTCRSYDALGRPLETALPGDALSASNAIADPTCLGGATGPTTSLRYELALDGDGHSDPTARRVISTSKNGGAGVQTIAFSDGLGRVTAACSEVDPSESEGNRFRCATTVFDGFDREIDSSVPFWLAAAPDAVPARADATPTIVRTYDALGRITAAELVGSQLGPVLTRYAGDGDLFVTTQTDLDGYETATYTDVLGHVVRHEREWQDGGAELSVPCSGGWCTTTMTHDSLGRLLSVAEDDGSVTTWYGYDWLGRRTSMADLDMGGFAGLSWSYGYDEHGNEIRRSDPNGNTIVFEYDALDRVTSKTLPSALVGDDAERVVTWHYDGAGPQPPKPFKVPPR